MIIETSAVAFRQNLGEMISQVQCRRDSIVITKERRAVAVLIDAELFERIRHMQERFNTLTTRWAKPMPPFPSRRVWQRSSARRLPYALNGKPLRSARRANRCLTAGRARHECARTCPKCYSS